MDFWLLEEKNVAITEDELKMLKEKLFDKMWNEMMDKIKKENPPSKRENIGRVALFSLRNKFKQHEQQIRSKTHLVSLDRRGQPLQLSVQIENPGCTFQGIF